MEIIFVIGVLLIVFSSMLIAYAFTEDIIRRIKGEKKHDGDKSKVKFKDVLREAGGKK